MRHGLPYAARASLILLLSVPAAWAQGTAQINGTVKDQGGLALPGVTVTVTQTATGLTRTTVTDSTGSYVLPNLPIGPYRFEAAIQGFRTYEQSGIVLQVGANPTLTVTLNVGQIEETVSVQGSAPLVETRNPGIGQVITNQQVLELPLNGRQLTELVFQAGLAQGGASTASANGAGTLNTGVRNYPTVTVQMAGGLSYGMTYNLDGGTHNEAYNSLNLPLPFPDAMQEFKVETSALPAQYGHHAAAAVNAVTKSGTNVLHGGVFEFMRDKALNATNAFAAIGLDGKRRSDGLHRDQFGGTVGGPVVPGKLFYFAGYQGTKINVTPTDAFGFVPTPAMLRGDFTAIASPACNAGRTIALRAPIVGTTVSPTLFSSAALQLIARLPQPIDECGRTLFDRVNNRNEHMPIVRVDYQMTNSHSVFGRYELATLTLEADAEPNVNPIAYSSGPSLFRARSAVLGDTYVLGSNTVNSFRVTLNKSLIKNDYIASIDANTLGIHNIAIPLPGLLGVTVGGGFTIGKTPTRQPTQSFQLVDDVSLVRGAHQIGMGVNYIHSEINTTSFGSASGTFTFSGVNTGLGLTDFLLGRPASFTQGSINNQSGKNNYVGLYLQDAWKVAAKVTINAGVRWAPYLPFYSDSPNYFSHFSIEQFRAGVRSTVYKNAPVGLVFEGDPQYAAGNAVGLTSLTTGFAPRLAGVWDPRGDGRMTVRAAYGRFYETLPLVNFFGFSRSPPAGNSTVINNATFDNPWVNTPGGNPFPITAARDVAFPLNGAYVTFPYDLKPPYADQWNVSVQQQLGASWMVSANYLSSRGHRLMISEQLNPAVFGPGATTANTAARRVLTLENPAQGAYYSTIFGTRPIGTSEYDALFLSAQHRSAGGLFLSANYTMARCISDLVAYGVSSGNVDTVKPGDPSYDRGSCGSTDQRHVANLSAVYEVPAASSGMLATLTKDWQLSTIIAARSGSHFNVRTGVDNALSGAANQRPDQALDDPYLKQGNRWLNPAAFKAPAPGTYGNLEVFSLVGPNWFNVDLALVRSFRAGGERQLQFRAEIFNLLNRVHKDIPVSLLNSPDFGLITQAAGDARILQLALKYVF